MHHASTLLRALLALAMCVASAASASDAEAPVGPDTTTRRRALRIAVVDLDAASIDPRLARVVTESLLAELRKLERVSVISFEEVRAMLNLESEKQMLGCDSADSCLAEIADAVGADVLITGTLGKVGADHIIGLKRIAQAEARAVGTFNKRMPAGSGEEFLAEIGPAVGALFPEVPLRAGQERGVAASVARRLSPPPLPVWVLPAGLTSAGVALAGAGSAGALQLVFQDEYRSLASTSVTEVVDGQTLVAAGQRAQSAEIAGWALLATGLAVGGATLVALPFIDFAGEGADAAAPAVNGASR